MSTILEAQRLLQSKQIRLCDIYGKYNFNGDTVSKITENQTIKKPIMSVNKLQVGKYVQLKKVIRYVLTPQDKRNPFMFRDFLNKINLLLVHSCAK